MPASRAATPVRYPVQLGGAGGEALGGVPMVGLERWRRPQYRIECPESGMTRTGQMVGQTVHILDTSANWVHIVLDKRWSTITKVRHDAPSPPASRSHPR